MFIFWYCHKRGKETRLAREQACGAGAEAEDNDDDMESDVTDEDVPEDHVKTAGEAEKMSICANGKEARHDDAQNELQESAGLVAGERNGRRTELEAEKSVGV